MFACIYIPNFPIAAVLRAAPELQGHAVAIFEGKPPLEKVVSVNENAKALGIAPGMTKAQAELCSELALRPRSPLQESSAHAALLDCAQSFSPCVDGSACDTVLLDLAGMESLLGPLPKIAHAISERSIALGLIANIAVAVNPDAAMIAARGFSGITVICPGKEAEQLGRLPVEVLFACQFGETTPAQRKLRGVGHPPPEGFPEDQDRADRLLETLERWGIRNLRGLAALPDVALSERLGQEGLHLQKLARGCATRALVPVEAPLVFEEAIELEHPIVLLEPLAFLLNRMLEQLCARLGSRALATQELRLTLELSNLTGVEDEFDNFGIPSENDGIEEPRSFAPPGSRGRLSLHTTFVRKLSLPLPMLNAKVFLKLLQLDLNAHPPGAPIVKVHLTAEPARPRSAQGGLFLPPSPEPEKLELTLARIAGIVGEQRVGAIELLDTHHPKGFRLRRFVAEVARKVPQRKSPDTAEAVSAVTALRRFRPPLLADVTLQSGQPVRLLCLKKKEVQGEVLWKAGPWRFSGDWWEHEAWSRDEWDLAVRNGETVAFYRLVHDLLGGGWFVEGCYD